MIEVKAFAKLHLLLDVVRKRPDGFHEVSSVMQELSLHDSLKLRKIPSRITIKCSHPKVPLDSSNSCWKAAELFFQKTGIQSGVEISIEKNIPFAAGLGGGTTDAAATLNGLNSLFSANLSEKELLEIASRVGSDTAFSVLGKTCIASGRGEILERTPSPPKMFTVICEPQIKVPEKKTAWAYSSLPWPNVVHPSLEEMLSAIKSEKIESIASCIGNSFSSLKVPEYIEVFSKISSLKKNPLALNACLCGSGPSFFAVCSSKKNALLLSKQLKGFGNTIIASTV